MSNQVVTVHIVDAQAQALTASQNAEAIGGVLSTSIGITAILIGVEVLLFYGGSYIVRADIGILRYLAAIILVPLNILVLLCIMFGLISFERYSISGFWSALFAFMFSNVVAYTGIFGFGSFGKYFSFFFVLIIAWSLLIGFSMVNWLRKTIKVLAVICMLPFFIYYAFHAAGTVLRTR